MKTSILFFSFVLLSCSGNSLSSFANKETDEAYFEDAQKLLNDGKYTLALEALAKLSAAYNERTDVRETLAGAYAGQCGMEFLSLVASITNSSGTPLSFFMRLFQRTESARPLSCNSAQTTMELFGNSTARTSDQNLFMFFLGISKIGLLLRSAADSNPNDGSMDSTFSSCANRSNLNDADVDVLITGFGLVFDNLAAVGASIAGSGAISALSTFQTTCQTITGIANCAITSSSQINATTRTFFRELIMTSDFGIGSSCTVIQVGFPNGSGGTFCCP